MAPKKSTLGERLMESLRFWAVVAIICGVVGLVAYTVGKRYVGSHLHEMEVKEGAPQISPLGGSDMVRPDDSDTPPEKPIVVVTEREPTPRERREAERELSDPQDGASLHADEAADDEPDAADDDADSADADDDADADAAADPDEDADADDDADPDDAVADASDDGSHVVSAGSFANAENAKAQVSRLAGMGYHPYVTHVEKDGVTFSRVNVGEFDSRTKADDVADELKAKGFDAAVWTR